MSHMLFSKISDYLKKYRIRSAFVPLKEDFIAVKTPETVESDPVTQDAIKVADRIFEGQWEQLNSRALKAHSADCADSWACTKEPCFKVERDKIVTKQTKARKKRVKDRDFAFDRK